MSSKQEALPAKVSSRKPTIVNFDAVAMKAPFYLRCGAVAFDYLLIIIWPVLGLLLGRSLGIDGAKLLTGELNNIAWLIAILVGLSNSVLLPLVTGQSLGKMVAGLRIVASDGSHPSFGSIMFRQTFGYLLTFGSLGLGFLFSVFSSKGRALHDYLAGSEVVFGSTSIRTRS
ncbi:MAG TPA: RDD family protein [Pyrinomonadaceae bacterium]|nr:RDD family protein [Pyrinomonadaceae bacterium]